MASTMEEEIYLAMQHVFFEVHAEIRRPKAIKRRIHACLNPAINALDLKYTRPFVVSTCQKLLEKRIFESTWNAEQRFPQLFQQLPPSPQVVATPTNAPETPEATRQEEDWMEKIEALKADMKAEGIFQLQADIVTAEVGDAASTTTSSDTAIAESTSTAFLSYEAQHTLFTRTQTLLEKACFDYAQQAHPKILEGRQWDSPECVELQKWMWIFNNKVFDTFRGETVPLPHTDWHTFFESIKQIRHKAVHREVLCVADVKAYLADAESLAKLLRQDECLAKLSLLREEMEMVLAISERKKDGLEVKYQAKFDEIEVRRKELDELERRAKEEMVREHRRMQSDLGVGFKLAVAEMKEAETPRKEGGTGGDKEEDAGSWGLVDGFWRLFSGR